MVVSSLSGGSVPASSIKSAQFFKVGLHWIEFVTHNPSPGRRNSENTTRPFFGVPGPLPAWGEGAERLRLHLSSHSLYLQMASDPTGEGLSSTRLPSTQPRSDAPRWPSLLHLLRTDRPPTAGSTDSLRLKGQLPVQVVTFTSPHLAVNQRFPGALCGVMNLPERLTKVGGAFH